MSVFVGRDDELRLLSALLRDPHRGQVVTITGPRRSGRTTLVTTAMEQQLATHEVGAAQASVTRLVASSWEAGTPFALLEQLGVVVAPDADPVQVGRDFVVPALAGMRVIVVEDAQHSDPGSLQALHSAVVRSTGSPVLVLVGQEGMNLPVPQSVHIGLQGLSPVQVGDLLLANGIRVGGQVARRVHHLTGGVPGDVVDLIAETPAAEWLSPRAALGPTTRVLEEFRRLHDAAPPAAWQFLQALAVLARDEGLVHEEPEGGAGRPLQREVAALAQVDVDSVEVLIGQGVVQAVEHDDGTCVRLAHPMGAAAVRRLSGPAAVRALHARAAVQAVEPGEQLRHQVAAAAGPDEELAGRVVEHARVQAQIGAWSASAQAWRDASRITADPQQRTDRLLAALDALVGAGMLGDADELLADIAHRPPTARLDATLGYLAILRGRPDDAERFLQRAWTACGTDEPELSSLVAVRLVLHSLAGCNGEEVVRWARRACRADAGSANALEAAAISGLGLAASGQWDQAGRHYENLSGRVQAAAQAQRIAMGRGWLELTMDDPLAARTHLESAVSAAATRGSTRVSLWAQGWLARALVVLGEWDEALQTVDRAAAQAAATGHELIRPLIHWPAAQVHALRGDDEQAARHLQAGAASGHSYPIMQFCSAMARAQVAEAQADYLGVLRALEPVRAWVDSPRGCDPGFWPWVDVCVNALALVGQDDEAEALLEPYLQAAQRRGHAPAIARARFSQGRILGARGQIDEAVGRFEEAAEGLSRSAMPLEQARVRFAMGQTLRRGGRRREADEVLRSARDLFHLLEATRYVERCERELKALGADRGRTAARADLTPQESAVVDLVAVGHTNQEVADELFVSIKTVQYHLTRVYAKLGLRSRAELAARYGAGSISLESPVAVAVSSDS